MSSIAAHPLVIVVHHVDDIVMVDVDVLQAGGDPQLTSAIGWRSTAKQQRRETEARRRIEERQSLQCAS